MRKFMVSHPVPVATGDQNVAQPMAGRRHPKRRFSTRLYASFRGALVALRAYRVRSLLIASGPFFGTMVATVAVVGIASVQAVSEASRYTRLIIMLCAASALVALLVGGYLCMRSMLAAVAERTSEMSMRRVVGARGRDICFQVMMEVLMLSSIGTVAGLVPGLFIGAGMVVPLQLTPVVGPILILMVCGGSIIVACCGGIYPALRAARVEPGGRVG